MDALRANIPISLEEAFRWIDDGFREAAEAVYKKVGSPHLTVQTAWEGLVLMEPELRGSLYST